MGIDPAIRADKWIIVVSPIGSSINSLVQKYEFDFIFAGGAKLVDWNRNLQPILLLLESLR